MVLLRLQACRCLASRQRQIGDKAVEYEPKTKLSRTNRRQSCRVSNERNTLYLPRTAVCKFSQTSSKNTYLVSINASILRTPNKSLNHPYQSTNPHEGWAALTVKKILTSPHRGHTDQTGGILEKQPLYCGLAQPETRLKIPGCIVTVLMQRSAVRCLGRVGMGGILLTEASTLSVGEYMDAPVKGCVLD